MSDAEHTNETTETPAPEATMPASAPEAPAVEAAASEEAIGEVTLGDAGAATAVAVETRQKGEAKGGWWWGLGRRKASVARVRIRPGDGKFLVNSREMAEFFKGERDRNDLNFVLSSTSMLGKVDICVNVNGGGTTGQAGAIILGLGRAILNYDPTLEPILRDHNFLSRDPRKVERKKYGQPGARKRFQFSKR